MNRMTTNKERTGILTQRMNKQQEANSTQQHISRFMFYILSALLLICTLSSANAQEISVGSKRFTESYVLGEIAKKLLEDTGYRVKFKQGMGGTIIVWEALKNGDIAMYPDYTGTIQETILKSATPMTSEQMRSALAEHGLGMTGELGFNNTYAFAMRRAHSDSLNIHKISDLQDHSNLKVGFTHEFLERADGWTPLSQRYGLQIRPRGMEHALAYVALNSGEIDLMDAYSTDAKLAEYDLTVLEDNLHFFPKYNAVFLYRLDTDPAAINAIHKLEGTIDEALMTRLNAEAERTNNFAAAASLYFSEVQNRAIEVVSQSFMSKLVRWTARHLMLVGISMAIAIVVSIPLGIRASRPGIFSQIIIGIPGIMQTVPSLALLAILVPVPMLGTSPTTAIVALFLYSLLPIVRNTATGLQNIPTPLRESAAALGLESAAQLTKVYLPMASRTILAGIKTSAIINVGTATLAALIGAGGLGEPIISGLALNNAEVILQGAIPAALLAILVQICFDCLDRMIIPRGLRLEEASQQAAAGE